jgi:hypothetical protein
VVTVGVTLPSEVTWVLDLIGVEWPNIDEDELRSAADQLRELGSELSSNNGDAKSEIEEMLGVNSAESLQIFEALWKKLADGHLQQLGEGMDMLATGLDIAAVVIVAMKLAAIVQLVILAAELIADQAAAIETLGASEALAVAQTEFTEQIVKQAIEQAIQTVEQQLLSVVEGPIFAALESAGEELAMQLVGDALGTHQGIDMGAVANAGVDGFSQGVSDSVDQVEGMADSVVNDPLGTAESVATNQGIPS